MTCRSERAGPRRPARIIAGLLIAALLVPLSMPGLRLPPPTPSSAHAQEGVPLPTANLGAHPRLLITQEYLDDVLIPRARAQSGGWVAFADYVESGAPEADARWTPSTAVRSLALAYLINRDPDYARRARQVMVQMVNTIETAPVMTGDGGPDGAFFDSVAGLALGYDWVYDALTDSDRAVLGDVLWRAASRLRDPDMDPAGIIWRAGELKAFSSDQARWLWALTATALALRGERSEAALLLDYCRTVLAETVIPALELQEGGAWSEGPVGGFTGVWAHTQTALALWTATGENVFDDTRWWYDRLAYNMFLNHPTPQPAGDQSGNLIMGYPSIIGDSERYNPAAGYGRAQSLLLSVVFEGYEHARWMAWYLRETPPLPGWLAVDEFLWRDPDQTGMPPPTQTWIAPYNGHVFMRSQWAAPGGELDPTATYVSFNAGDRLSERQFYDSGSFTIAHTDDDLLVRSGVYSGSGASDHDANYYGRSIAANTILICDLAEIFDGIRPNAERDVYLNDCGQRGTQPSPGTAINVDYLVANWRAYDTGSLLRTGTTGGATYVRADLTGAYNSSLYTTPGNRAKVSAVIRELIYWRPGIVIVSDRVVTTYPAYTPLDVFHFQTEPQPEGVFFRSVVGDSALYLQNLRPDSLLTVVSGYQVAGQVIDRSWGEPVGNAFETEAYGPWRLEISPNDPALEHWFMTVFVAQPAVNAAPAPGQLVLGDGVRGVVRGEVEVIVDPAPEDNADVTEAAFQIPRPDQNAGIAVRSLLVTGLTPNADYQFTGEGVYRLTITASSAGMVLLPDPPPGIMRLAQAPTD